MKSLNLVLHCGGSHATREQLSAIKTPEATQTWRPIPHTELISQVESAMGKKNMRIVNETYGLAHDGARMFGILQIANCKDTPDYSFVVGLRNSHDKSIPAGFCVGSGVFVCDNLAFSSEVVFGRRHTVYIMDDLPVLIDTAIGKLSEKWDSQGNRIAKYKETEIDLPRAKQLVIDAAHDEVFPRSRVMDVYEEFVTPKHPEFQDRNVWSFFNAVTEVLKPKEESKGGSLWSLPSRTQRLHNVCDTFCGITLETPETVVNN